LSFVVVACRLLSPRTPNAPNWERNKYEYNVGESASGHLNVLYAFNGYTCNRKPKPACPHSTQAGLVLSTIDIHSGVVQQVAFIERYW
jgi:hypothetical protein